MSMEKWGFLIPVVAIIMGVALSMLNLVLDYRKKREVFELHHKERMAAIEKGMEVPPLPPQLFTHTSRRATRTVDDQLRSGLILLFVGAAIGVALYLSGEQAASAWGLVPASIGLAKLVYVAMARGRGEAQERGGADDARS
jgi:hypothetical protein